MKIYDIIVILSRKNREYSNYFILFFKNTLIYNGFIILNIENWKIMKFSYKINGEKRGLFLLFRFYSMNFYSLQKVLNFLRSEKFVIRFLLVNLKKNNYFLNIFSLRKKKKNASKKKSKEKI